MKRALFITCFLGLAWLSPAQVEDTVVVSPEKPETSTLKAIFKGPPGKAFVYSLILPGAGQVYNKRYWKLPLVYAAYGVTGYILIDQSRFYDRLDKAYRLRIDFGNDTLTDFPQLTTAQIGANREITRKNVQRSYIALGLVYFLTAAEAFVDRHLMTFDMSEDLGFNLHIGPTRHGIGVVAHFNGCRSNAPPLQILH
ncbi:MAG: DUF5683 domain-containing protein [Saprospiraceae bacterium]|nr:DUF5683 domain-containing protein [Saprospiraceae bacterium]